MPANMMLVLLLTVMVGFPAELINSTLKEHYDEVNRPFVGIRALLVRPERAAAGRAERCCSSGSPSWARPSPAARPELRPIYLHRADGRPGDGVRGGHLRARAGAHPYIHAKRSARWSHHLRLFSGRRS
ncbi:MAG: hypothetical protein R2711_11130 [Acidimicrobiales bacterium]